MEDKQEDMTRFYPFLHTYCKRQGKKLRRVIEADEENRVCEVKGGRLLHTPSDGQLHADLNGRKQFSRI